MKSLLKTIFLILVLFLSFSFEVFAKEPVNDNDWLYDEIRDKDEKIKELQKQLEDIEIINTTPAPPEKPRIMLVEPATVTMFSGRSSTFEVVIKNVSNHYAYNVLTQIKTSGESPIIANFENRSNFASIMTGNSNLKMKLKINADESTKTGVYSIPLSHTYYNKSNEELTSESVLQIKVTNDTGSINVVLKDIATSTSKISAGDNFSLKANVVNDSQVDAKDVQVTIDGLKSDEIFIRDSTNIIDIADFSKGSNKEININLTSNPKIKTGSYPLTLKLSYRAEGGEAIAKDYSYYINIGGQGTADVVKSEIYIESITMPPNTVGVGENFRMVVSVKNNSAVIGKNIKISANPAGEGEVVPKSTSVIQIMSINPGEKKDFEFLFAATSLSKSQNYVVGFTVEYETGDKDDEEKKELITFTQYQGVNVINHEADRKEQEEKEKEKEKDKEEEKTSVPKIIINDYKCTPMIVSAGKEFDLDISFLNTSANETIKNIKAYFTIDDGTEEKGNVFSPVNSSNTFFIDSIAPKGTTSRSVRLFTIPDAKPKTYNINVNFEYEDIKNNEIKATEIIGINVKQVTKLDTSEITYDSMASVGQPLNVNFQMYNTGKVTLSNLIIKMEGNFDSQEKSTYYGTFNPSDSEYYENMLIPTETGEQEYKVIISYEDDLGEYKEDIQTINVNVEEAMMMDESEMEGMMRDPKTGEMIDPNAKPKKTPLIIGGIVIGVIAAIVIVVVVVKRRKKQRSFDLDE